jgi:hypothetical protein
VISGTVTVSIFPGIEGVGSRGYGPDMPYLVKFVGAYREVARSELFDSLLDAHAFAKENFNKYPEAAVLAIAETDRDGTETSTAEVWKR